MWLSEVANTTIPLIPNVFSNILWLLEANQVSRVAQVDAFL